MKRPTPHQLESSLIWIFPQLISPSTAEPAQIPLQLTGYGTGTHHRDPQPHPAGHVGLYSRSSGCSQYTRHGNQDQWRGRDDGLMYIPPLQQFPGGCYRRRANRDRTNLTGKLQDYEDTQQGASGMLIIEMSNLS